MTTTYSTASQKGGVGKTSLNLALALTSANKNLNTVLIDLDDQASASDSLIADIHNIPDKHSCYNLITGKGGFIPYPVSDNLFLIPASLKLLEVDDYDFDTYFLLKERISECLKSFDIVVIDTPGTLKTRLGAAIAASDYVFSPIELSKYSYNSFSTVERLFKQVKKRINPLVRFAGFVPNRVSSFITIENKRVPKVCGEREVYDLLVHDAGMEGILSLIGQRKCIRENFERGQLISTNSIASVLAESEIKLFTDNLLKLAGYK